MARLFNLSGCNHSMTEVEQFVVSSGPKTWQRWNNRMAVVRKGEDLQKHSVLVVIYLLFSYIE
ncbi:hypothetical protein [Sutcliffiella rhizosphaerae]|uniref:hypothetical protein n=1 Tax=Sutcliffiella rhizosphaerae TaxID=2880967 RepID=UPI001E5FB203|nr:hypothetical protein [Sutcliffiella rhizosphaerae]